ncbi:MAG: single-stranded DNA-binding protein [Nitrospinota bacterium]
MTSFNRVILMGNLTRDPEVRYTPQGTPVAKFGLAVNRRYRQGEEQREETCFVDIVAFGRQAELVGEYLAKGRLALVEGRLQYRTWEGEDGVKRSKHEVVAQSVKFMPSGGGGRRTPAGESDFGEQPQAVDDDIPF